MLNSLSNKAMITKSRAMYGKRLTNENYQDLVRMKSVREIASYLKETPGYADVLSNIYPESVHRGQLELLLHKSLFNKYIRHPGAVWTAHVHRGERLILHRQNLSGRQGA